ncbi:transposase [Streptomyces sp. NPDC001153]
MTAWLMRNRDRLSTQETEHLDQARPACPDIARACDLDRAFTDLVRNRRRGQLLPAWIRQAEESDVAPVAKFAAFLRQDFVAVTAGLTHEWSSGKIEGHVNRVKTIKRAMYGRASFRLLRIRIRTRPYSRNRPAQRLTATGRRPRVHSDPSSASPREGQRGGDRWTTRRYQTP